MIGLVDSGGTQGESNEENNVSASAGRLAVRADLVVASVTITRAGTTLTVQETVKNQGPLPAGSFRVDRYLSKDGTITASDVYLGNRTVAGALAYNATSTATSSYPVPSSLTPGAWKAGAIADAGGAVPELLETNNTKDSASIRLKPNLVAASVLATASGRQVTFTETVKNDGAFAVKAPIYVNLYLSLNNSIGATDTLVGTRTILGDLAPGASSAGATTVTVPSSVPAGPTYGGIWADRANAVSEVSETDNKKATASTITLP